MLLLAVQCCESVARALRADGLRERRRPVLRRLVPHHSGGRAGDARPDSSRPSSAESSLRGGTVALEAMEVRAKQREHARRVVDLAMAGTRRGRKNQEQVVVEIG